MPSTNDTQKLRESSEWRQTKEESNRVPAEGTDLILLGKDKPSPDKSHPLARVCLSLMATVGNGWELSRPIARDQISIMLDQQRHCSPAIGSLGLDRCPVAGPPTAQHF